MPIISVRESENRCKRVKQKTKKQRHKGGGSYRERVRANDFFVQLS